MSPKYSSLHDRTVEILFKLCKETRTDAGKPVYSSIYADHIGLKYRPIILTAYIPKKKPLAKKFSPDVWAQVKRKRRFDVYEVWHTETETDAIEDILFSLLVEDIRFLHIICTGQNLTGEDARELVNFIIYRICDDEGKKMIHPGDIYIADLPKRMWNDNVKIKKHLQRELLF